MPEETLTSKLQPLNDDVVFADDNRETMIKVDHVSMEFNMASEKLNSLKEYFIAIAKHNLYFEKFTALNNISFEVKKGDVFGILGTNGSGKSTLLKIIAGVLEPTKGSCEILGNIAPLIELGAGFDMELSARENIYLNGSLLGYSKSFIEEHFNDIVEFAEVEKFLDTPMKNYSSGMVARIAFAIATVIVPEILIVDEVLSVGDFMFQQKCEDRIKELIEKHNVTVLIVSHSNEQIERLCNKAIWIEKGHSRIIGDAPQVCRAYCVLGGRSGSAESEKIVYEALQQAQEKNNSRQKPTVYTGKDYYEIASNAVLNNWNQDDCKSVFLVPDHTHVFDLAASGLAGALNAPILPISNNEIPPIIKNTITTLKPESIHIVADREVAINFVNSKSIKELATNIIPIPCDAGCRGIRLATLQFGIANNLWNNNTAILAFHDDVALSFAISPLSYMNKIPFIITDSKRNIIEDDILDLLNEIGVNKFIAIGAISCSTIVDDLTSKGYEIERLVKSEKVESFQKIFGWIKDSQKRKTNNCMIASQDKSKWQAIISCPSICGKGNSSLLLEDITNLDSVAMCITELSKETQTVSFMGYQEILGENSKLLNKVC